MTVEICGFLVLRKPNQNFDDEGRGGYLSAAPCIKDLYYSGIDRMPWFDFDEGYYSNELNDELLFIRDQMNEENKDFSGIKLLKSFADVEKILNYSNQELDRNEIAVVFSELLAKEKATLTADDVEWLGVDIYCPGYGSQIREGVFTRPEIFSDEIKFLNKYGLFPEGYSELIRNYIKKYIRYSKLQGFEPIDESVINRIDTIKVGRLGKRGPRKPGSEHSFR